VGPYIPTVGGKKGHVRTNSNDPTAIEVKNNGQVWGDAIYGPGADLTKSGIKKGADVTGDVFAAPDEVIMPPVVIPQDAREIRKASGWGGNSNDISLSGTTTKPLESGVWIVDNISITGSASLTTDGPVVLYVRGPNVNISGGGIVNGAGGGGGYALPSDLLIYCLDSVTKVAIGGNGVLTGAVYAPNADISLNGVGNDDSKVYGALVGKTVTFNGNGVAIHYDEALGAVRGAVLGFRPKNWEEA
jgi:hypothetical protein